MDDEAGELALLAKPLCKHNDLSGRCKLCPNQKQPSKQSPVGNCLSGAPRTLILGGRIDRVPRACWPVSHDNQWASESEIWWQVAEEGTWHWPLAHMCAPNTPTHDIANSSGSLVKVSFPFLQWSVCHRQRVALSPGAGSLLQTAA